MRTPRKDGTTMIFLSPYETRTLCEHQHTDETIMITLSPSRNQNAMRTSRKDEIIYGISQTKNFTDEESHEKNLASVCIELDAPDHHSIDLTTIPTSASGENFHL